MQAVRLQQKEDMVAETTNQHFLDIAETAPEELKRILSAAAEMKQAFKNGAGQTHLSGKSLALVFEKPSTRTRVSFEVAMYQLGGHAVIMDSQSSQMGRGESIADTARTLSRYVDIIMFRCFQHETLLEMAKYSAVPVINGLTDMSHPCQLMADVMTFEEHRGPIAGKTIAWVGDCNNMANSWIQAAEKLGFTLHIACPEELLPPSNFPNVQVFQEPKEAVESADLVTTDTWVSMGDEDAEEKRELLKPYQVNDELMALAKKDTLFMHCLPAHRGDEVTDTVIDGAHSVVWDEAENRMHVQKAILCWCLGALP